MAISTFGIFLMHKASGATDWEKLIDIKDFPDMGGEPDNIDITTTSDYMYRYIGGIESSDSRTFTANYDLNDYKKLKALEGKVGDYALWAGFSGSKENPVPDGHDGKWEITGELYVYVNGGSVNEAVNMTITLMPTEVIKFVDE